MTRKLTSSIVAKSIWSVPCMVSTDTSFKRTHVARLPLERVKCPVLQWGRQGSLVVHVAGHRMVKTRHLWSVKGPRPAWETCVMAVVEVVWTEGSNFRRSSSAVDDRHCSHAGRSIKTSRYPTVYSNTKRVSWKSHSIFWCRQFELEAYDPQIRRKTK